MWLFEQGSGGGAILQHKKKKKNTTPARQTRQLEQHSGGGTQREESEKSESQKTLKEFFFFLYNNVGDHTGRRGAEMRRHVKRGECLKEVWRGNTWLLLVPKGERETGPSWCGGGERREEKRGESER